MGCSGRVKEEDLRPEQKWDFISLNDFKNTGCFPPFAYAYLVGSLVVSIAVYGVDTFTAVNLLAFDKWSGAIAPAIDLDVGKWIFSACIILSWLNVAYEHFRAMRVMKRGAVAESFLDSLAVRLQCVRWTKTGRGYKRFLVFAELTKSKKGAEYVALFTYFSFQSWIRIIFCQGPRQVINAVTLYAVFEANFEGKEDVGSTLSTFFTNIGHLAEQNNQQAVVLSGMIFTLVIWVFGVLSLLLAILFYSFFLWHYIPNRDGGLTGYCRRKVDKRLSQIVSVKVNKAIEEEERRRQNADKKGLKKGEKAPVLGRQATLPTLFDPKNDDKLPNMPTLTRNDTMQTLPLYSSRPGTPSGQATLPAFELNNLSQSRPFPNRNATNSSVTSFGSNAPLMGNVAESGRDSPAPSIAPLNNGYPNGLPSRPMTSNSSRSQWSEGPITQGPPRMPSAMADRGYTSSPVSYTDPRSATPGGQTLDGYGRPVPRPMNEMRSNTPMGPPSIRQQTPYDQNMGRSSPENGRNSPAPSGYAPYNPGMRSASAAQQTRPVPQQRNVSEHGYFVNGPQRPGTAQSMNVQPSINRLASPAPYNNGGPSPGYGPMGGAEGYRRS
ncbi:hypothetical protein GLAREA_01203 [Glarea lozoyensis ATCC 20868]|uniref:Vacuolar membrane protein n=1 Tax=Glarea lozoyensis (strain ATCC 20868 / MF5171) TaxID=1116229 RepID=S3CZQ7_GLAL2|nr:uncharacterized protein GLAREA_01203 [Glarea lozoyensis ATCC 20868]EPE25291.1 hypothetical protein GLAREA_01203 [Glarea lozoyensis ATCC 20868]